MDEIINISVNGYSLTRDANVAGTQGECDSRKLRISFSENWSEYAKSITFWNALGKNPVKRQLGTDFLEDILTSYDVYLVPIPGEAMTESGEMSFVIDGIIDGKVKRSVEGKLKVLYSPQAVNAGNPASVTPDLANQIRAEIDEIKGDIAKAEEGASYAEEARLSAETAKESKEAVENMTVSSETLEAGEKAKVEKTFNEDSFNLHFGIPAGESGVYVGDTEPTDPNIKVWVDTSGDADEALKTEKIIVGGTEMYTDEYGVFYIDKPETWSEIGVPNMGGCLCIDNGELLFNGEPVGAGGGSNVKDLTADLIDNPLTETEKANFMRNTGLDARFSGIDARLGGIDANITSIGTILGEMDAAIDEILAAQEALIGGDGE